MRCGNDYSYRAPTPVSLPASQPRGVCSPAEREPTAPPPPRESGFADANDSLRARAASCTGDVMNDGGRKDRGSGSGIRERRVARRERGRGRTGAVDLVHVRLEDQAALDDLGKDVVCLRFGPGMSGPLFA